VKAVCAKLGGVETLDLAEALDEFSQACVKFDCAKGDMSFQEINSDDPWLVCTLYIEERDITLTRGKQLMVI
jgi:hypothetical protein